MFHMVDLDLHSHLHSHSHSRLVGTNNIRYYISFICICLTTFIKLQDILSFYITCLDKDRKDLDIVSHIFSIKINLKS